MANPRLDFERLDAYQLALVVVDRVHEAAGRFPQHEQLGLRSQLCRGGVSITANIAEAVGRDTMEERRRIYFIARGSLYEALALADIARRRGYLDETVYRALSHDQRCLPRMLSGLIRACRLR